MIQLDTAAIDALIEHAQHDPYFDLYQRNEPDKPYMRRWWLTRPTKHGGTSERSARIHQILRSDADRHLHDHPADSTSIILRGCYWEEMPEDQAQPCALDATRYTRECRGAGTVVHRRAEDRHRLIVPDGGECWSLFLFGPRRREWGFHVPEAPGGWVQWEEYEREWAVKDYEETSEGLITSIFIPEWLAADKELI